MDFLNKLFLKLSGYKTYFLGIGAIVTAIGMYLAGSIDLKTMVESIWAALAVMGLRHGVTTEVNKIK